MRDTATHRPATASGSAGSGCCAAPSAVADAGRHRGADDPLAGRRNSASSRCRSTTTSPARRRSSTASSTSSSARSTLPSPGGDWRARDAPAGARPPARCCGGTAGRSACWSRGPPRARRRCDTTTRSSRTLRAAGFSLEMTAHAYALIDSYVYGFALQEAGLPFEGPDTVAEVAEPIMEQFAAGDYPHLVEMATELLPATRLRLRRRVRLRPQPHPRRPERISFNPTRRRSAFLLD